MKAPGSEGRRGIDIWRKCRFMHTMLPALGDNTGANHCLLCHLGWEQCGHVLTSRPRETSDRSMFGVLFGAPGYPAGSASGLLGAALQRYCHSPSVVRLPLPTVGVLLGCCSAFAEF